MLAAKLEGMVEFQPPRAAYVHVPFCRHRCGYCNFTLVAGRDDLIEAFLRAVDAELASNSRPQEIETLYFGGGTPSHLPPAQLRVLAESVLHRHPLAAGHEWTIEVNPADASAELIDTIQSLGITRISLGAQSFRDEKLTLLERDHSAADIERAVALARQANLAVSLDLIFATPGESLDEWQADLDAAISLDPDHVSTYGLTFEQGTTFWGRRLRQNLSEVGESLQHDMYALSIDRLSSAGYEHYEVSNFARPGQRSRHNETYWSGNGYFAYGPGAARFVNGIRETNHRSTTTYIRRMLAGESPVAEREQLPPEDRAREQLIFSLRRLEGVSRSDFRDRNGINVDDLVAGPLTRFVALGFLLDDGERIKLSRAGLFVSDALWPEFL
jgi:oxygen-independent coproporphyrinogen-3 oxidase